MEKKERTGEEISIAVETILTKAAGKFAMKRKPVVPKPTEEKLETLKQADKDYIALSSKEKEEFKIKKNALKEEKKELEKKESEQRRLDNIKIKKKRDLYLLELCEEYQISMNYIIKIGGFNMELEEIKKEEEESDNSDES